MNKFTQSLWMKWSLIVLAAIAIGYAIMNNLPQNREDSGLGSKAPSFALPNLQGETIRLADFRGRVVLLNFWASWCNPCVKEMPLLNEINKQRPDVELIAVNIGEKTEIVKRFVEELGLDIPVVLGRDSEIKKDYRISGLPVTLLIDKDGRIIQRITGEFRSVNDIESLLDRVHPKAS